jgi:hypothetical protein
MAENKRLITITMPDGTKMRNVPYGTPPEQVQEAYESLKSARQEQIVDDASILGEVGKSAYRGAKTTGALVTEGLPALFSAAMQELTGDESWQSEEKTKQLVETLSKIENDPALKAAVGSTENVTDVKSAALFLANAGQVLPDLAFGLGAGALTKAGTKAAVKGFLGKELSEAGGQAAFKTGLRVQNAATIAPSELAGIYAETGQVAPFTALGSTAVQVPLETLGDLTVLGLDGKKASGSTLRRLLRGTAQGALTEGTTEAAQGTVSELAQEFVDPEKATFDTRGVIDQAVLGATAGGTIRGPLDAVSGAFERGDPEASTGRDESFKPEDIEEEIPPAPVQQTLPEITDAAPVQQAPSSDLIKRTALPQGTQRPSKVKGSSFNLYSNIEDDKVKGYLQESLDLIGFDEDVMFVNLDNMEDDKWTPLSVAERWLLPDEQTGAAALKETFKARAGASKGLSATLSRGLEKPVHVIGVSPSATEGNPSELVRTLAHEAGHIVLNRFVQRDPELKEQFISGWKNKLEEMGVPLIGISDEAIAQGISSWSFNNQKEYSPELTSGQLTPFTTEPLEFGSEAITNQQYNTAFDEYFAENVARWYQSTKEPLTVLDKFFKSIADLYKRFLQSAKTRGLMPEKDIKNFMDNLVTQTKSRKLANDYRNAPELGLSELRAYHASPYKFTKFSTDNINTGEGYQAFGWGLYFTDSTKIRDFYRKKFSDRPFGVQRDGEVFQRGDFVSFLKDNNIVDNTATGNALFNYFAKDVEVGDRKELQEYIQLLENIGFSKTEGKESFAYTVNIPEEQDFIDWDKPVSEDVKTRVGDLPKGPMTGQEMYENLVQEKGSAEKASKYLNSLGIKGIRYPAGTLSGIENSKSKNYVVFDDTAIAINEVYTNDNLLAALNRNQQQGQNPFQGLEPKNLVLDAMRGVITGRKAKSVLRAFTGNLKGDTPDAFINVSEQYAVLSAALNNLNTPHLREAFRGILRNRNLVSNSMREYINTDKVTNKLLDSLRTYTGIPTNDLRILGRTELQTEAFNIYLEHKRDPKPETDAFVKKLPKGVVNFFDSVEKDIKEIGNDLSIQGIQNLQDLTTGQVPDIDAVTQELLLRRAEARKTKYENIGVPREFVKNDSSKLSSFGKWAWTPRFVARYSPLFADVKRAADERREIISGYIHTFFNGAQEFFNLDDSRLEYLAGIMDEQRILGTKATVNNEGHLVFSRGSEDKKVIMKDKELVRIYTNMQNLMGLVPSMQKHLIKVAMTPTFAKAGLSINTTQREFELYKELLKSGQIPQKAQLSDQEIADADSYFEQVRNLDNMKKADYVPHIRFGDRGVVVKNKEGETVWFGTFETDNNGKPLDKEQYAEFLAEVEKYKEDKDLKVSEEFNLTYDAASRHLGADRAKSLELMTQILNGRSAEAFKEFDGKAFGEAKDYLEGRISRRSFTKHFGPSDNVQGYTKDWRRATSAYFRNASYYLGNLEYEPKIHTMNGRVQSKADSRNLKNFSDRFVESIMNPEDNFTFMRELQYFYAMGANPSSAALQLASMLTFMPTTLTMVTGSPISAAKNIYKAARIVPKFLEKPQTVNPLLADSIMSYGDADTHEKLVKDHVISRETSELVKNAYNEGILQALYTSDFVGAPSDYTTKGLKGKWQERRNNVVRASGFMMRAAEEYSRGVQAIAAILSLEDPANTLRIHKNLMQNDAYYRSLVNDSASKEPDKQYIIKFLVDKSLGEYGREGRSAFQNTIAAVTVLPFATYPVQMLLNIYEMVSGAYGKDGRRAGLYTLGTIGLTAGLWGLPGTAALKETVELVIQQILGEDRDLDEELRAWAARNGVKDVGIILSEGVINAFSGVDLASRISYDIPFYTEFVRSLQGETTMDIGDLAGVGGSVVEGPIKGVMSLLRQEDPLSAAFTAVPNVAVQNVYKGLVQFPAEGKDFRNLPTLLPGNKPEDSDLPDDQYAGATLNRLKRALGFKPISQLRNEKAIQALKREEMRYENALGPMRKRIQKAFIKQALADDERERARASKELSQEIGYLVNFANKKQIPNINRTIRSTIEKARLEAYMKIQGPQGEAARKALRQKAKQAFDEIWETYK